MKKLFFLFLLLLSHNNFAQKSDNSQVDLRAVFNQQVEQIKQQQFSTVRETKTEAKNSLVKAGTGSAKNNAVKTTVTSRQLKSKSVPRERNIVLLKIFVLFEASLLAAIVVLYRRKKLGYKKLETRELKKNIKKLREEKLIVNEDSSLNVLRKGLSSTNIPLEDGAKGITRIAKKLSIAKGEVYLAAKISLLAGK